MSQAEPPSALLVCPGIHDPSLTRCFLQGTGLGNTEHRFKHLLVFPSDRQPVYSGWHVGQFLRERMAQDTAIAVVSFSAGVVGAIAAALAWQATGGKVSTLIALDGWGVALGGSFPIHRVSHDRFTHWSSALLGAGEVNFYADPPVAHLELWRSPETVRGWQVIGDRYVATTAAQFISDRLRSIGQV